MVGVKNKEHWMCLQSMDVRLCCVLLVCTYPISIQWYLLTREHNALFVYDLLFLFLIADINKETGVKHVVAIGP